MDRRRFLFAATACIVVAVLLAASGGARITVGGLRLSARTPWPTAAAAAAFTLAWWWAARRSGRVEADLDDAWEWIVRRAAPLVALMAAVAGAAAMWFATASPAGADASGYLSQAALLGSGHLLHRDGLASVLGGPPALTAPLGWVPAPIDGWQSPTYPPGLPLLMAAPHAAAGAIGASAVVAGAAMLSVWTTASIAVRLAGPAAGLVAAAVLATLPVFLFQAVQPMSDVPVTAAWLCGWWLLIRGGRQPAGGAWAAGCACALAVLIRPNLAPLALAPLAYVLPRRTERAGVAVPLVIAGAGLAWLQWYWYGSPLRSGYGSAGELFALANVAPNAAFYLGVTWTTAPLLLIAPAGLWRLRRERAAWAMAAFAVLVVAAYLVYAVFEDWSYLRFLLPGLAVGAVFVGAAAAAVIERLPRVSRAGVIAAVLLAVVGVGVAQAREYGAFALEARHQRVLRAGAHLRDAMPPEAVIVAGEQSGAMRYLTGRPIVRWEAATPADLARALAALEAANRPVWIVLDAWEDQPFRAAFAGVPEAALDWPPDLTAGTTHRTSAWSLASRDRFRRGAFVPTTRLP